MTYFITFSCYGTYLPGQPGTIGHAHNRFGSGLPEPRPKLRQYVESRIQQQPFQMDAAQRKIVLRAMVEVCHYKAWFLSAAHVRATHVHVLVGAAGSTRYLWVKKDIDAVIAYLLDGQGERMAWYQAEYRLSAR